MAAVLVMVNQGQPDINSKKLIFMLWTSFAVAGLLSKKRSFLIPKFVVFITLLQTCDASSLLLGLQIYGRQKMRTSSSEIQI